MLLGDLWHSCGASTEVTDRKADMWWEMDRKWARLEALLELWWCYFHTSSSPALSTRPPGSSDWTGSVTVSGWNRLRCCFYYILHPSLPPSCPTLWLRPLLVIYLFWAFLIWARVAHHCSQRVCLREWKLHSLAVDLWTSDMVPVQQAATRGEKLLHAALSSLNHIQMNRILFLNFQEYSPVFRWEKTPQNSLFCFAALVSLNDHLRVTETFRCSSCSSFTCISYFWHLVMLISMSVNCQIKNVRNNEAQVHKDQDVMKYSRTGWSFIGHVIYWGGWMVWCNCWRVLLLQDNRSDAFNNVWIES